MKPKEPPPPDAQGSPLAAEPEDEALPIGRLVAVTVVSLVAFALAILWAFRLMRGVEGDTLAQFGPSTPPAAVGQAEIGMVDQTIFTREKRATNLAKEKLSQLESYGWVSRTEGVIHIPIAEAMKAVAQGRRPQAGAAPAVGPGIVPTPPADGGTPDAGTAAPANPNP